MNAPPRTRCTARCVGLYGALALLIGGSALAQGFEAGRTSRHELVSTSPSVPAFGRVLSADLIPDLRLDAVVLQADGAWVVSAADAHGSRLPVVPVGTGIVDLAIASIDKTPTLFGLTHSATSGALQLEVFEFQPGAAGEQWVGQVVTLFTWATGTELQMGDLDGDGVIEALVLDGQLVHRAEREFNGKFSQRTPISLPVPSAGFRVGPWSSLNHDDILAHDGVGVAAVDVNGNVLSTYSGSAPISCWTSWWSDSDGEGRAAIVRVDPGSNVTTMNVIYPGGHTEASIFLGQASTTCIDHADFTGDGLEDVVLLNRYDSVLFWLFNTGLGAGSTTTFRSDQVSAGTTEAFDIDPNTSMAGQVGAITTGDFDSDGDLDCAFACDATGDLHVKRNERIDECNQMLDLVYCDANYTDYPALPSPLGGSYNNYGNFFRIHFSAFLPSHYTHIEVVAYQVGNYVGQVPYGGHAHPQTPRPVGAKLLPLTGEHVGVSGPTGTTLIYMEPITCHSYYYTPDSASNSDEADYIVTARLVEYDQQSLVASSPESIWSFHHSRTFNSWAADAMPVDGNPAPPTPLPDPDELPPESTPPTPPPG